jgi:hypothetical protein
VQLLLFFREQLGLAFAPLDELSEFEAAGVRYRDRGAGFMTSTYDRLTDAAGRLIGFVVWGVPAAAGVAETLAALPPRPYLDRVVTTRDGQPLAYAVYLTGTPQADADSTGDQAFGGQCFEGAGGEFALSIDLGYLLDGPREAEDLATIRAAPVHWLTLTNIRLLAA